jgi:hypothetical protein
MAALLFTFRKCSLLHERDKISIDAMMSVEKLKIWWELNEHKLRQWRQYVTKASYVLAAILILHFIFTVFDPIMKLSGEKALEREQNIKLLNVATARLKKPVRALDEIDEVLRRPCTEVMRISEGRTSQRTPSQPHYGITNLLAINRQLIMRESIAFAMPKMLQVAAATTSFAPDACILSIFLSGVGLEELDDSNNSTARIVDMLNPREIDLRTGERQAADAATESVELKDLLIQSQPLVTIESQPLLRVHFRTAKNSVHVVTLRGTDAHLMRVALRLLNNGEPVSAWGTVAADFIDEEPPQRQVGGVVADEL